MVLLGFPILVKSAMAFDVTGVTAKLFGALGITSYAVYVLHQPASLMFEALITRITHLTPDQASPYGGIVFSVMLIIGCWFIDWRFDQPVRKWLTKTFVRKQPV